MPIRDDLVGNLREPLKVLLAAVGALLLHRRDLTLPA